MSPEHCCGQHQTNRCRNIIGFIGLCLTLLSVPLVVVFLTIFPTEGPSPSFTLHDVKLYAFNVSTTTSTLTSSLKITISSGNPEDCVSKCMGIDFHKVDVYASYKSQQITLSTMIPRTYLGHLDVAVWSMYLNGTDVPVPPNLAVSLAEDVTAREVLINVKATGRLRSKYLATVRYELKVDCPTYVKFGNKTDGHVVGSAVKHPSAEGCRID